MRKKLFFILLVGFFFSGSFWLYYYSLEILEKNRVMYKDFKDEKLVDVDGLVNLSGVKTKKEGLEKELYELFGLNDYNRDTYLKQVETKKGTNNELKNQLTELFNQVTNLEAKKTELSNQYVVLKRKYDQLYAAMVLVEMLVLVLL